MPARVRTKVALFALSAAFAALLVVPSASATLMPTFSLRGMTLEAHAVLRGTVVDHEVVYDARFGRVYTHTIVQVAESLHGHASAGDFVVVRQLGGVLDGVHTHVVGTAALWPGDEVLLFARTDGAYHYLIGMSQGAFRVERAPDAPPTLVRSTRAMRVIAPPIPAAPAPPERQTLDAARAFILATLAADGGR